MEPERLRETWPFWGSSTPLIAPCRIPALQSNTPGGKIPESAALPDSATHSLPQPLGPARGKWPLVGLAGRGIPAVALTKLSAFACVTLSRNLAQTLAGRGLEGIRKIFSKNLLKGIDRPREAGYISKRDRERGRIYHATPMLE